MIIAVYIFLALGAFFGAIGAIGVLRMPDVYGRLQASTCISTMGCICITIAGVLYAISSGMHANVYLKMGVLLVLVLGTNPISNHALCKAAYRMGVKPAKDFVIDDYKDDYKEDETV